MSYIRNDRRNDLKWGKKKETSQTEAIDCLNIRGQSKSLFVSFNKDVVTTVYIPKNRMMMIISSSAQCVQTTCHALLCSAYATGSCQISHAVACATTYKSMSDNPCLIVDVDSFALDAAGSEVDLDEASRRLAILTSYRFGEHIGAE